MKIGLLVDGDAEYRSLPEIYDRLRSLTPHQLLKPLRADLQPLASVAQIVTEVRKMAPVLIKKGAELIIVLLDRENRDVCSGRWAEEIATNLNLTIASTISQTRACQFAVMIKNSCYENWLVSDVNAFSKIS